MNSIFKSGLIASLALVLLGLFGASSAVAGYFEPSEHSTGITGEPTGLPVWTLEPHGAEFEYGCEVEPFTIYDFGNQTKPLTAPDMHCAGGGYDIPVEMNGCAFDFNPGEETAEGTFNGTFDISDAYLKSCGSDGIKFYRYGAGGCWLGIGPVNNLSGVTYKEVPGAPDTIEVSMNQDFKVLHHQGTLCNVAEVSFRATWEVSSYSLINGSPRDVHVNESMVGLFEPPTPHFEVQEYPSTVTGSQGAKALVLAKNGGGMSVGCSTVSLSTGFLPPSSTGSFSASYGGCTMTIGELTVSATMEMSGCSYEFALAKTGLPYTGTVGLVCGAGSYLTINAYNKPVGGSVICTYQAAPQSGFEVGYANSGSGASAAVTASLNIQGLALTRTKGIICPKDPTTSYTGDVVLKAVNQAKKAVGVTVG